MDEQTAKPLIWVSASRKELMALPVGVRRDFGYAFYLAQLGGKHKDAKPLAGFRGRVCWRSWKTMTRIPTAPSIR